VIKIIVLKDLFTINCTSFQNTTGTFQLKTEDLRTSKQVLLSKNTQDIQKRNREKENM